MTPIALALAFHTLHCRFAADVLCRFAAAALVSAIHRSLAAAAASLVASVRDIGAVDFLVCVSRSLPTVLLFGATVRSLAAAGQPIAFFYCCLC